MKNQLAKQFQTICKNCHSVRKELNYDELPEHMKKDSEELKDHPVKFFYCEKCRQISISFESESF